MNWSLRLDQLFYGAAGAVFALWAGLGGAAQALLVLNVLDLISGTLAAGITGQWSSRIGAKGLYRKGLIWCLVGGVYWAQQSIPGLPAANALTWAFVAIEVGSLIENAGRAGVPLPALLTRSMQQLRELGASATAASTATPTSAAPAKGEA